MPTISVDKYKLFEALGRKFTKQEFEDLCFEFGIELDEDTEEEERPIVDGVQEPPQLKIEIPANRYDMLCFEGIALNLNIFMGRTTPPQLQSRGAKGRHPPDHHRLARMLKGPALRVWRHPPQHQVHQGPVRVLHCAAGQASPESGPSANTGVHRNPRPGHHQGSIHIRGLASAGLQVRPPEPDPGAHRRDPHDLLRKRPTSRTLPTHHQGCPPYTPLILDANRVICSLPPIINGDHSKITLNTTNVFIEITATDITKLDIVTDMMVTMFSEYCAEPFTVEPVKIISDHNNQTRVTPHLRPRVTHAEVDYLNSCTGLNESRESLCKLLSKMAYVARPSDKDPNLLEVAIPPTRADVLHQADIMEDVAVCYGFNRLPRSSPNRGATVAAPLPINKLSDIVRIEAAMAGWSEVMPLTLCSHDENFAWLNRKDDGNTVVRLANPKTLEYQVVRTSLLPGLIKTIRENKGHSLPIKIFEAADVVFKDEKLERRARNERHFAAAWCGKSSGFEVVHGLLDRLLLMLRTNFIADGKDAAVKPDGYWIEELNEDTFFHGHAAAVYLRLGGKEQRIGEFGILHPSVLEKFDLRFPVSTLEINLEVFL
ncbi:uncharacterized protein TrAtP1_010073 [Trichoderma atroviride]|uniref:uncharacterized protein n=1 Tax=Hypocrea atroviridis TaxID=63577 RepID=UPI00332B0EF3|nr:hypothetical protein TrAtP1_010073 [Trichoderma atroviride]